MAKLKVTRSALIVALCVLMAPAFLATLPAQQQPRKLQLMDVLRMRFWAPAPEPEWAPDGKHLVVGRRWMDPKTGDPKAPERPKAKATVEGRTDLTFRRGDQKLQLTRDGKPKELVFLSPDEGHVAYVQDNDLWVVDTKEAKPWQVTKDGGKRFLNGKLDWVYQEEVYGRGDFEAHWWSPDSKKVAFLRLDEKDVKTFTVIDHVPAALSRDKTVRPVVEHYPKAGDPNPTVQLMVADVANRKVVPVDLDGYEADILIVRVGWSPDNQVVFQVQNRIQTWLDLVIADPATGKTQKLLHEDGNGAWVNILGQPRWLSGGSFLWLSERTGYKHIYHYQGDKLVQTLTSGEWQVRDILKVSEEAKTVWFTGTKDGAVNNNAYRVGLDGSGLKRLTQGGGWHEVKLNGDGSMFVDRFSSLKEPTTVLLCDGDGKLVRELHKVRIPETRRYQFKHKELLKIPARDGFQLDATLLVPGGDGKHPVWVDTYSGPDFPTVRNSWSYGPNPDETFLQFLCGRGFIVLQVNVRSASGRGQKDTKTCYKNFGEVELKDLVDAVDWVCKNKNGDAARVGITGWSYGGFMTAYALTHSKKFALGIAGAGVYDWRLYDTIYTERYMDTPQNNERGYQKSSCIAAAARLSGHLCIQHGGMDDNVHLQNAMQLSYALQNAGKSFDMMIYPKMMHGPRTLKLYKHKLELNWKLIQRHLLK